MSEIRPTEARQGRQGKPVLMILIVALALCVVVAAGLAVYSNFLPGSEVGTSATSTPTDNPPPAGTTVTPSEGTSTGTTAPATTQQQ